MRRQETSGFTLIELMIVVAVIGILGAIAYPAYTDYVRRGKIIDAQSALSDYRVKLEQYYQDNRNYGAANGACGVAYPDSTYFTYSCVVGASGQSYTTTAQNKSNQGLGNVGDYTFTINESNTKGTTEFKGASTAKSCWLVKGDEC